MDKRLAEYITGKVNLSDDDMHLIGQSYISRKVRKNHSLLVAGDTCKFAAFVTNGCLRLYSVDQDNIEHIIYFAVENWWAGDRESYQTGEPSKFYIDAVEDSEVLLFSKENFEMLLSEIPSFKHMIMEIMMKGFIASQSRVHSTISHASEERYLDFLEKYPQLVNRIPQHMIASFLGMTPETLSRIRKTVFRK